MTEHLLKFFVLYVYVSFGLFSLSFLIFSVLVFIIIIKLFCPFFYVHFHIRVILHSCISFELSFIIILFRLIRWLSIKTIIPFSIMTIIRLCAMACASSIFELIILFFQIFIRKNIVSFLY